MEQSTRTLPRQSQLFFLAILVLLVALSWVLLRPFFIYMVTGTFVAVLALPIDKFWERFFPNRIAAGFSMFSLFLIIALPLAALGLALASDAQQLARDLNDGAAQEWVDNAMESPVVQRGLAWLYPSNTTAERNQTVQTFLEVQQDRVGAQLAAFGTALLKAIPNFILAVTITLFVVYYVLTDGQRLVDYIRRAAPLPARQVDFLMQEARQGLRAVFVGQILTSLIQGGLGGIGFIIAGVPGAIVWAAVMAVLSLLPVVGAFLVWMPAALLLFLKGEIGWSIFLFAYGLLVVSQVDNFIRPKLIGNRANIHPLFVLLGVLGGVTVFGFIGLFLGPLLVAVTISVLRVWESDYLEFSVGKHDPTYHPMPMREVRNPWLKTAITKKKQRKEAAALADAAKDEEA